MTFRQLALSANIKPYIRTKTVKGHDESLEVVLKETKTTIGFVNQVDETGWNFQDMQGYTSVFLYDGPTAAIRSLLVRLAEAQ